MCKCPSCGAKLNIGKATWTAEVRAFSMRGQDAATLETIPQPPLPAPAIHPGAYIETPVAQQNIESNVKVPLAQSLITGAMIGGASACVSFYAGLPKPLLIIFGTTLVATYRTWTSGVGMADSLLTRIEDYTKIDINRDGVTGSAQRQPQPELRFVSVRGNGRVSNQPAYEPEPQEQFINIPGMPRSKPDEDPWTVERLADVLERAFISERWGRQYCTELGMSQGQWSVLSKYLGDEGEYNVWGTTDRPTLDVFVEQIRGDNNQPTSSTNQPE